jgi:tetratricopeptide (TPR) repeat protein
MKKKRGKKRTVACANNSGSGTLAQNGGVAAGQDGIAIGGDMYGPIYMPGSQPAASIIPRQLPPLDTCFLGRDRELTELLEQLRPGKVAAVCGPSGMGKSALAAQAVSRLEADRFPDGIVFHSFYHQPSTDMALQTICNAFGVEAKAGLASTVRQVLAGRKALLILDGAEEADDLPAVLVLRGTCGVLITSRKRADAQGFRIDLKPLEKQPAAAVFCEHSGAEVDDESVAGICKILDGWPVGLRIAGRYCSSTGESAAEYLRWLKKRPFRKLSAGRHQKDNMALLLKHSLKQVSADAVQALQVAGVLAFAPIILMPFALVLLKEDEDTDELELRSNEVMGELVNYGLLEATEKGWQASHVLIHTYARTELALSKESLERLAGWYIDFCETQCAAGVKGYAILDGERAHCLRLMESCLNSGLWNKLQALVRAIEHYLHLQAWWTDMLTAWGMRLTAARQAGDRKDEGECLNNIGYSYQRRGEHEKALIWLEQSLSIRDETGDRQGACETLNNIAWIYLQQGIHKLALHHFEQSLSICQEIGDIEREGMTLDNIGQLYRYQDDCVTALQYFEQCLPIRRKAGDKRGESVTMNNIAAIYRAQGNPAMGLVYLEQALEICRELGYRAEEAEVYWNIGRTYEALGDLATAEEYISLVVQIAEKIGHPELERFRDGLARVRAARRA